MRADDRQMEQPARTALSSSGASTTGDYKTNVNLLMVNSEGVFLHKTNEYCSYCMWTAISDYTWLLVYLATIGYHVMTTGKHNQCWTFPYMAKSKMAVPMQQE